MFYVGEPDAYTMDIIAIPAFIAYKMSFLLLYKYKNGDSNVRSVRLYNRNDATSNLPVLDATSEV